MCVRDFHSMTGQNCPVNSLMWWKPRRRANHHRRSVGTRPRWLLHRNANKHTHDSDTYRSQCELGKHGGGKGNERGGGGQLNEHSPCFQWAFPKISNKLTSTVLWRNNKSQLTISSWWWWASCSDRRLSVLAAISRRSKSNRSYVSCNSACFSAYSRSRVSALLAS